MSLLVNYSTIVPLLKEPLCLNIIFKTVRLQLVHDRNVALLYSIEQYETGLRVYLAIDLGPF